MAELATGKQFERMRSQVEINVSHVPIATLLRNMVLPVKWFWTKEHSDVPMIGSPIRLHAYDRVDQYLEMFIVGIGVKMRSGRVMD